MADATHPNSNRSFTMDEKAALLEGAIDHHCKGALEHFKKVTRSYALFHITFFSLGFLELIAFVLFFSFFTKSSLLSFALAGVLLTVFSYSVLLFYFQAKKPEELMGLRNRFVAACNTIRKDDPLLIAFGSLKLIDHLNKQEYTYYSLPKSFKTLSPLFEKFSSWWHWKDVYQMKELLLFLIIEEQIELVKIKPLDLQTHAALGDAYIELAKLYTDPRKFHPDLNNQWISSEYESEEMKERFIHAAEKAVTEFKIVAHFAPEKPWVHAKLASIYSDLGKKQEEIKEYEAILQMTDQNKAVLFRLAILYFEQGLTAEALEIYQSLKEAADPAAEDLISYYS